MYIGISAYNHESSVSCIDESGLLIDYCREESLSRIKGDNSFPKRSLTKVLKDNNISIRDIHKVCFYERPLASFLHPLSIAIKELPESLPLITHQLRNFTKSSCFIYYDLSRYFNGLQSKLVYCDHHLSHTLSVFPYIDRISSPLCSVVLDGFGDRSSASICSINSPSDVTELWSNDYPHSLGLFYSAITDFLGFAINEGEYKVMGLSAYGDSSSILAKKTKQLAYWCQDTCQIKLDLNYFCFHKSVADSYSDLLCELLGDARNPFQPLNPGDQYFQDYADIARGAQDCVLEILTNVFEYANRLTGAKDFLYSGGVAMNSASLGVLADLPFVRKIHIPPSPGDAGASIGAACFAHIKYSSSTASIKKASLFPSKYSPKAAQSNFSNIFNDLFAPLASDYDQMISAVVDLVLQGEVVGVVWGNAETGPRALGNRSLICDGTNRDAVNTLNTVIKNRSPFRPTAPAMLYEDANKIFELRDPLINSYYSMSATVKLQAAYSSLKLPTLHVDGTARLQIVKNGSLLSDILHSMPPNRHRVLANSSLNMSGDPTCYDVIDALMVSAISPLKFLMTEFGVFQRK